MDYQGIYPTDETVPDDTPVSEGEDVLAKYQKLYLQNEDMVGWISIEMCIRDRFWCGKNEVFLQAKCYAVQHIFCNTRPKGRNRP